MVLGKLDQVYDLESWLTSDRTALAVLLAASCPGDANYWTRERVLGGL